MKNIFDINDELDDDGKKLWNLIGTEMVSSNRNISDVIGTSGKTLAKRKVIQMPEVEKNMRTELKLMILNSKQVIIDCAKLVAYYTEREEYFKANEAKVSATIHSNFIERIQTILSGSKVFSISHEKLLSETNSDNIDLSEINIL